MFARIYSPTKTAMQSGKAKSDLWILEFEQSIARYIDPLTGWTGAQDMSADQIRLEFDTEEAAVRFAKKSGIPFKVMTRAQSSPRPRAYADNFSFKRRAPWTH